jgi:hypothetical protein
MTIWRMRIACWITKAIKTHSKYVILIAYPLQQRWHERGSILRYTHIVSRLKLSALCIQIFTSNKTIWGEQPRQVLTTGSSIVPPPPPLKL